MGFYFLPEGYGTQTLRTRGALYARAFQLDYVQTLFNRCVDNRQLFLKSR